MKIEKNDISIIRDLTKRYVEAASKQDPEKIKKQWRNLHDCKMDRPMIYVWAILFTDELEEIINLECVNPFLQGIEQKLKIDLYHHYVGDDYILEPYLEFRATYFGMDDPWGVSFKREASKGGAYNNYVDPPLKSLDNLDDIKVLEHEIDELKTAEHFKILEDAVGDIILVHAKRSSMYTGSFPVVMTEMRGMNQLMIDMVDNPEGLHVLLRKIQKGVMASQEKADLLGDIYSTDQHIQSCPYSNYTVDPLPIKQVHRKDLWCYAQAQDFTLISPAMHKEFALDYQKPLMEKYAASAYGCCEDITHKIDMLRDVRNLKQISVTPASDLEKCAAQIGSDYVISWRPNPSEHVCLTFDRDRIRRLISEGCEILNKYGCQYEINLKDVISVCQDRERIPEWVSIVRGVIGA